MAWAVKYTDTARRQLRTLGKPTAQRVLDYMDGEVAALDDPRERGQALTGPLGGLWRYRVGKCRVVCDIQDRVLCVLVVRVSGRDQVYR